MKKIARAGQLARQWLMYLEGGFTLQQAAKFTSSEDWDNNFSIKLNLFTRDLEMGYNPETAAAHFRGVLPKFFLDLFLLGSDRGNLSEVLGELVEYYEYQEEFIESLKSKLYYPCISLVAFLGLFLVIVFFVLPVMAGLYRDLSLELPGTVSLIISTSQHPLTGRLMIMMPFLLPPILYFSSKYFVKDTRRTLFILNIPVLGRFYSYYYTALFFQGLSLSLKSGREICSSLEAAASLTGSRYFKLRIEEVIRMIEGGEKLTISLEKWLPLHEGCWQILRSGENTGRMIQAVDFAGRYYQKRSRRLMEKGLSRLEPLTVLILSGAVGITALLLLNPIWKMFQDMSFLF